MSWKKSRDRAALMASMLERVPGGGLNEVLKFLLVHVVKTFFVLTGEDAERYRQLISRKEFRAVQEVELTWADKLMEKGREAGVIEGKRKTLLRQMSAKFGEVPEAMTVRVAVMSEADLDPSSIASSPREVSASFRGADSALSPRVGGQETRAAASGRSSSATCGRPDSRRSQVPPAGS